MFNLSLTIATTVSQEYNAWDVLFALFGGILSAIAILMLLVKITEGISHYQAYRDRNVPYRIMRKALEDMVQHDIETDYQNRKSITDFLPRHARSLEMDDKQLAYVAKVYEELVHDAEKRIAQRRAVDRMFERLEAQRQGYLEQLEEQEASKKSLY